MGQPFNLVEDLVSHAPVIFLPVAWVGHARLDESHLVVVVPEDWPDFPEGSASMPGIVFPLLWIVSMTVVLDEAFSPPELAAL